MTVSTAKDRALDRLKDIIETGKTKDIDGNEIPAHAHCSLLQTSEFIKLIERDERVVNSLEIGCAHGVSSLAISGALSQREGAKHVIIDPMQHSFWSGSVVSSLTECGLENWELIEEYSEFALPTLAKNGQKFDLIFVDGWHTFDHGLIDAFYATKMLNIGGYLLLDDTNMPGLWKLAKYLMRYPCYELVSEVPNDGNRGYLKSDFWRDRAHLFAGPFRALIDLPRMVVLQKTSYDERPWNWYERF